MHLLLLLFTSLLAKPAEKSGLYTKDDFVELLDYSNFQYALSDENKFWVVEFYASWCGHCQHFAPYVKSWAAQMQNWGRLVNFGVIDCGKAENSQICSENAITGMKCVLLDDQQEVPMCMYKLYSIKSLIILMHDFI